MATVATVTPLATLAPLRDVGIDALLRIGNDFASGHATLQRELFQSADVYRLRFGEALLAEHSGEVLDRQLVGAPFAP